MGRCQIFIPLLLHAPPNNPGPEPSLSISQLAGWIHFQRLNCLGTRNKGKLSVDRQDSYFGLQQSKPHPNTSTRSLAKCLKSIPVRNTQYYMNIILIKFLRASSGFILFTEMFRVKLVRVWVKLWILMNPLDSDWEQVILLDSNIRPRNVVIFITSSGVKTNCCVETQCLMNDHVYVGQTLDCVVVWKLSVRIFKCLVNFLL